MLFFAKKNKINLSVNYICWLISELIIKTYLLNLFIYFNFTIYLGLLLANRSVLQPIHPSHDHWVSTLP